MAARSVAKLIAAHFTPAAMKSHTPHQFLALLCLVISLGACSTTIEPIEIKAATAAVYKKPDGSPTKQPTSITLNSQQIHSLQTWLNTHRENWGPHNPKATLLPQWCASLETKDSRLLSLCDHRKFVVLRDKDSQIERPLSEGDISSFSKLNIQSQTE